MKDVQQQKATDAIVLLVILRYLIFTNAGEMRLRERYYRVTAS